MNANVEEEFNGIKFLKSGIAATIINPKDKTNLFKVFFSIVYKNNLEVDQCHLQQILTEDLKIDKSTFSKQLSAVLVDALRYYIIQWPGWQRKGEYQDGTLNIQDWFTRFQQYLVLKSRFIIQTAPKHTLITYKRKEIGTQTDIYSQKPLAPYILHIAAPPFMLNNIVFEERNGDIFLRTCVEKDWKDLTLKELMHWPHVRISLKLPDISLSRSNVQHVERYMGMCEDTLKPPELDHHIIHIKKILESTETCAFKPFSLEFFVSYVHQLNRILKKVPGVPNHILQELKMVLQEFINDINEADIYNKTMCTYVSVKYHIGKFTYLRNRRMILNDQHRVSTNQNAVNMYESIVPQMDFTLNYFNAVQDHSDHDSISFVSLNQIEDKLNESDVFGVLKGLSNTIRTCLVYSCTLCQQHMCGANARNELNEHLRINHKAEQSLICFKCFKEFNVYVLASNRWRHYCSS